ncbi:MAG: hypothetical protein KGZ40_01730 [Clostridiales bacterium]|nr:hypothetical protein [Clostridiales bacterium]
MTDEPKSQLPAKPRSLVIPVAAVLLATAVFAGAFVFLGGIDLVDNILGGGDNAQVTAPVPPKPTEDPDAEAPTPPGDGTAAEETPTAPAAPAPPVSPVSSQAPAPTPPATVVPATGVTVPADARARMYWEQVDSQEQIGKLVGGKISSFSLTPQSATATEARLRVSTNGNDPISGTVVLRAHDGAWFFSSITRDGNASRGAAGRRGDISVIDTIVEQQTASQDVIAAFVDGGYRTVKVNRVSTGSGTVTIDVEFGGGTKPRSAGQIVAISKDINGVKHWFLTSFREL